MCMLVLRDQLSGIFIDEIHTYTADAGFRHVVRKLPFLMCIYDVEATLNKCEFEKDIVDGFKLHMGNFRLIRQSSNRRNIEYSIETKAERSDLFERVVVSLQEFAETDCMIV